MSYGVKFIIYSVKEKRDFKMNRIEIDKNFRGNVYITQGETVLSEYCDGFADLANEIPNCFETRFACASMGKTFVAVGILQLIESGKLSFSDSLGY